MSTIGKTYHSGQREEVDVILRDDIPYTLASSVIPQGSECDELARLLRITLPGYIMGLVDLMAVNIDVAARERAAAVSTLAAYAARERVSRTQDDSSLFHQPREARS